MLVSKTANQVLNSPEVLKFLPGNCKWWTDYVYHFSHITNIAKILNDSIMVSRNIFETINDALLNDNASGEVINGTELDNKDYVRFYFRPLTPTQFHNEGIRSRLEISRLGAHCPVPVFLFFDNSILDEEYTYFTYESLASHYQVDIYNNIEDLSLAPFHLIYHTGQIEGDVSTIVKHRHAEVIIKDTYNLNHLSRIVCRNIEEANTLKDLLSEEALYRFEDIIYVTENNEIHQVFNNEYLHITSVTQTKQSTEIWFNRTDLFNRDIKMQWLDREGNQIGNFKKEEAPLKNPYIINMNNFLNRFSSVRFQIKIDGSLVYSNTFNI